MSAEYPKKYWWVILIIVPLVGSLIAIIPSLFKTSEKPSETTFNIGITLEQYEAQLERKEAKLREQLSGAVELELEKRNLLAKELAAVEEKRTNLEKSLEETKTKLTEVAKLLDDFKENFSQEQIVQAKEALRKGDTAIAEALFSDAVEKDLAQADEAAFQLGVLAENRFDYATARDHFKKASDLKDTKKVVKVLKENTKKEIHNNELKTNKEPSKSGNEQEPNNTVFEANLFSMGTTVSAEISSTKDQDYFKFQYKAKLRDQIKVTMESRSTTLRPWVKVYDKNKSEILDRYNNTYGANLEFTLFVNAESDYYLQVLPYDGSGKYRISVIPQQAFDRYEPNDEPFSATSMDIGQVVSANIMDPKDTDWYRLAGINPEEVTVRIESRSTTIRPWVKVYDKNKSEILDRYNNTYGADLEFIFKAEQGSNYYLQVLPYDGQGKYQIVAR